MISSSQRPLPDNTKHSQQTNIHTPGGIRTHDLSRRAVADLRLRPRSHRDRHFKNYVVQISCVAEVELINTLNAELNPICYLLALSGAHHFLHFSRIRVKSLTLRLLMSYIYEAPILDVPRSHTTTHYSRYDSSGRVISSSQRPLPDNTRHSQQTNIHAPGGIRIHDFSR